MRRYVTPFALLAAISLAGACGSGSSTTPVIGSIALSVTPTSATIQQGGSTQVTGTLTRTDFTGDVTITVIGAPSGVTGVVTLAPINGGNTAQVTISAISSTVTGTYPLTVVATGSGVGKTSTAFSLTITAATPASYTMTLGTPAPSIAQNGPASSSITIARTAFTGDIALTAENLPTGVTATFTTNPVTGTTSSVNFTATAIAAPGTFNTILIRGTAVGLTDVTASVALTVTVTGTFSIAYATSINVTQGNNVAVPLTVTRNGGFAGTIAYTVTGPSNGALPTGLTAAVTPTGTADQNTLTVTTTAALAAATYPIVVHATSFGIEVTQSANVIVAPISTTIRLDYSQCSAAMKPLWLAYQDGTGAFTHVVGTADVYTFNVVASKAALATVVPVATFFSTTVQYVATSELAAQVTCPAAVAPTGKTITGSTAGLSGLDNPEIAMGGSKAFTNVPLPTFTLTNVPAGVLDLISYRRTGNALSAGDKLLIHRDQNIADGGSTGVLNFDSDQTFLTETATVNVTGASLNSLFVTMNYLMGASCASDEINFNTNPVPSPFLIYGVPTAQQRPSDFHNLYLQLINGQADERTVSTSFHTMASLTVPIGAGIGPVITSTPAGAYQRLQAMFTLAPDYRSATLGYFAGSNGFTITQSEAYLGGVTAVTLAAPDFTTALGYLAATWGPQGGINSYGVTASSAVPPSMCAERATLRTASTSVGGG